MQLQPPLLHSQQGSIWTDWSWDTCCRKISQNWQSKSSWPYTQVRGHACRPDTPVQCTVTTSRFPHFVSVRIWHSNHPTLSREPAREAAAIDFQLHFNTMLIGLKKIISTDDIHFWQSCFVHYITYVVFYRYGTKIYNFWQIACMDTAKTITI